MQLPTLEHDFWTLRSGEESHRAHPDKFFIPPIEERRNLQRGNGARLIFEIEAEDQDGKVVVNGERMWVVVAERVGDLYIGILVNEPATFETSNSEYLCIGAEIPFAPEHIIDIDEPPADYVEEHLGQKPERIWPRN